MKRENIYISIILVLIIILILLAFLAIYKKSKDTGIKWNGETRDTRYVKIPSFTEIYFNADTKIQAFNFFNPSSNNCSMMIALVKDGEVYYESDAIRPGYGLREIKLNKTLDCGDYQFTYIVECCGDESNAQEEYNGVNFNTTIHVR